MVNNIKNNTISEADDKKKINALNEIKKVETKNKHLIKKKLLNLFDELLETIFNNNNNNKSVNENDNATVNKNDNENVNDNDTVDDNANVNDKINNNVNDYDNADDYDNVDDYEIMKVNNYFGTIDETKSFEDQTEELIKEEYLSDCWHMCYYDNNKEINFKIFKLKCAYILIDIDEDLKKYLFLYLKKYLVTHL